MRVKAIVEVVPGPGDRLPAELVAAAYRASRSGLVALALNAVERRAVDALLDAVVRETTDAHGVRYVDGADDSALDGAGAATIVIASTDAFRDRCCARGVPCIGVAAALPVLAELAARPLPGDVGTSAPSRATPGRWASSFLRLGAAGDASATSAA